MPGPAAEPPGAPSDLPRVARVLLARRGLLSAETIQAFLAPRLEDLHDPFLLPDMAEAAGRVARAVRKHERIVVFGDYDVDGTTGTALLVRVLRESGAEVEPYTPNRAREGYGLSETGVRLAREQGCSLVVTVDCGTSDLAEVELANSLGLDVVVTDHHEVKDSLPQARAVVNPERPDSRYPFPHLCGCGVAFKLAQAVLKELGRPPELVHEHLDLVALATIADIVPLSGENRILARNGLERLQRTTKPGLRALLQVAGRDGRELGGYDVGFLLGPRINASGRMADAAAAVRLMLTEDRTEAVSLAHQLDAANTERRSVEDGVFQQALGEVARKPELPAVLVLADEAWHEGVIGIVASRLADRFHRPAVLISLDGDRGKGSGRSIPGFHLHDAVKACSADLLGFGGHKYAAGLTIERSRLADFERHINDYARPILVPDVLQRRLEIDCAVGLAELDGGLLAVLRQFEPFGPDNPQPLFVATGLEVVGFPRRVGREHLKFTVREFRQTTMPAIAFRRAGDILRLETGRENLLDIAFQFGEHTYGGRSTPQLVIKDLRIRT